MDSSGLAIFDLTIQQALALPRGKRRSVVGYCLRFGYCEEARDMLRVIAADDPEGMFYRLWLIDALLGCGDIEEADSLSTQLLADFPDKQRVLLSRAKVLFACGEIRAGYDVWLRFSRDPHEGYSYWANLGAALQHRGWWTDAGSALDQALSIYKAKIEQQQEEDQQVPVYLWLALARQEEHDGINDGPHSAELERLRRQDEEKIREILARPDPKERLASRAKHPVAAPRGDEPDEPPRFGVETVVIEDGSDNTELHGHLRRLFGFSTFRKGQQQIIESVLARKSVLAVMPTGGGKSLCYQLPAMLADGITLVISPLIALMKDQVDGLPSAVQRQATVINSSLEGDEIERRLKDARAGRYKLVYAAPERLRQRPFLHAMRETGVSLLVVDEAHCVSMWGHDFRPDYLFIGDALRYLGEPTVLAMTATATPRMRVEIAEHFGRRLQVVSTGTHRPNLFLESTMMRSDKDKMRELVRLCREIDGAAIVYTRSRKKAEELAHILRREGVKSAHYHAGMDPDERSRAQEEFMDGRWRVICATVAFGMGIDKSDVRAVIHYSLPQSIEDYYQEAGRAGRDGLPSRCILLATPSDKALTVRWMREERLRIETLRDCYRMIRELTSDTPFAAMHVDDFVRDLRVEETHVRVAISMLEDVGLVKRHLDVPMTATIALTAMGARQTDQDIAEFVQRGRLRMSQRIPFETLELCARTGVSPSEIEEKLLGWRAKGWLAYHGSGRVMLLERLPAPKDARQRLERLLGRHAAAQEARVEQVFAYVESRRCKHGAIAEHFGDQAIERCASCDSCKPQKQPEPQVSVQARSVSRDAGDDVKDRKVLETVKMLSGRVGFTGLVRVLKGSVASNIKRDRCPNFGILAAEPKTTIERRVASLLEQGYLLRDDSEFRLITLGPKGERALRAEPICTAGRRML